MKKTLSRLLSLALVLAMVCAMLPAALAAGTTGGTGAETGTTTKPATPTFTVDDTVLAPAGYTSETVPYSTTATVTYTKDEDAADPEIQWAYYKNAEPTAGEQPISNKDGALNLTNATAAIVAINARKPGVVYLAVKLDGTEVGTRQKITVRCNASCTVEGCTCTSNHTNTACTCEACTKVQNIVVTPNAVTLQPQGTKQLTVQGSYPACSKKNSAALTDGLSYSSSNEGVATVSNGTITAVADGTANITVMLTGNPTVTACVTVTVQTMTVTKQPTAAEYTQGSPATALTVAVSGGTEPYTYQWYEKHSASNENDKKLEGAKKNSYTPSTNEIGSKSYYCIIKDSKEATVTSNAAKIVTKPQYSLSLNKKTDSDGDVYVVATVKQGSDPVQDQKVNFRSSSPSVAAVDSSSATTNTSGKAYTYLTVKDSGTVTITASLEEHGTVTRSLSVYVNNEDEYEADDIYYDSDSDGYVTFDEDDFYDAVDEVANGDDLVYVKFTRQVGGQLYKDNDTDSQRNKVTPSIKCYYDSYYSGGADLDEVTFEVDDDEKNHYVDYTAYDDDNDVLATGRVYIDGGSSEDGDVTYYVDSEESVALDEDDFEDYFLDEYEDGDFEYVKFQTGDAENYGSRTYGYLYESDDDDADTVSSTQKYYYGGDDDGDYDLDEVEFRAGTKSSRYVVEIPFTAYGEDDDGARSNVSGTLTILVNDDGEADEAMTYYVDAENTVALSEDDFEDYFLDEYEDGDFEYVKFQTGDAKNYGSKTYGYLYESDETKAGKVSTSTKYYFEATSSQDDLDEIEFRAGTRTSVYTVKVPFTASGEDENGRARSVDGTLTIVVNDRKGVTITTDGATFDDLELVKALKPKNVSASKLEDYFVRFDKVTGGTLYDYYKTATNSEEWSRRDEFYFDAASDEYDLADVFFLPKSTAKSAEIEYTLYRESGSRDIEVDSGKIVFKVEPAKVTVTFTDVPANVQTWAGDAIEYMAKKGYVGGTGAKTFSPNANMSRAMLVTVLYRMAGEPSVSGIANPFKDVVKGSYYYDAVLWAYSKGYVTGKSAGSFAPNANVSRQEIAAILYRYAGKPSAAGSLTGFADYRLVSGYASDAMKWATHNEIITGIGGKLVPGAAATRAQVVAMLYRYLDV